MEGSCEGAGEGPIEGPAVGACDGLWDVANDQEVCNALLEPVEGDAPTAQALANKLLIKALKQGTTDNVSIVVIKL